MADFEQKNDLDLRYGGSTLGDFGYFYDVELPWLFACINSIRRNQAHPAGQSVEPVPYQIKIEDDKLFVRDKTNSTWVYLFDVAFGGGLREQGEEVLTTADKAGNTTETKKNKLAVYDEDGNLPANITGNSNSIAGYRVDTSGIQDGQIMAYNAGLNKWESTDKFSGVGAGKALALMDALGVIASYNGGTTLSVDMPVHALLPNTTYSVGDVANTRHIPTNMTLVCVEAGTTPAVIPEL